MKFILLIALNMPSGSIAFVTEPVMDCKTAIEDAKKAVARAHGYSIRTIDCYPAKQPAAK